MVTQRGVGLLVGSALAWLAGRVLGVPEMHVVAVSAATLVLAAGLAVLAAGPRITVRRRLEERSVHPGAAVEVAIDVRNTGRLASGPLLVEDACPPALRARTDQGPPRLAVPALDPGTTVTLAYDTHATARGRWRLGPTRLQQRDPFGIVQRLRVSSDTSELLVYPRVEALPVGTRLGLHHGSGTSATRRVLDAGDEFHSVREYRTGDDLRHVHWASTARRQSLMVRQHEQAWNAQATVLLDTRAEVHHGSGDGGTFEPAVTAAASVLVHLAGRGYETRLATTAGTTVGQAREGHSYGAQLEHLAEVTDGRGQSLRAALQQLTRSEGLLVAVLAPPAGDPLADPETRGLLHGARGFATRVALVVASGKGAQHAAVLATARWRTATLDEGVAAAWQRILDQSTRRVPA